MNEKIDTSTLLIKEEEKPTYNLLITKLSIKTGNPIPHHITHDNEEERNETYLKKVEKYKAESFKNNSLTYGSFDFAKGIDENNQPVILAKKDNFPERKKREVRESQHACGIGMGYREN